MLSQAANVFLVFIMIYIFQYIFNSQFSCSCTPEFHYIVIIYLGLIPLILFFILKIMKQTKTKVCAACLHGLCPQILQLLGIALFWGGFVLLDGDLFLCLITKHNDTLREIPCKKDSDLTLQEKSTITIFKNWSQFCGYICIAVGFFGWWLTSNTKIGICCESISCRCLKKCCCEICSSECRKNCYNKICKVKPYYETRYEELLSEETDKHLDERLRQIAKKRAERICSNHICDIENNEFRHKENEQIKEKATEAWSKISRSNFYDEKLLNDINDEQNYIT